MEFVFVVPRRALFPESYPHGLAPFHAAGGDRLRAHLEQAAGQHGFFVERERAEREPEWKQIIPYTILCQRPSAEAEPGGRAVRSTGRQGEAGDLTVLLLERTAKGGDSRLHHKLSVGVGGHINPEDARGGPRGWDWIRAGSRREIAEELVLAGDLQPKPVGLINDDSNAVGAVHVGLVQVLEVPPGTALEVRERDVLQGRMATPRDLEQLVSTGANLESWSRLLVPHLRDLLAFAPKVHPEGALVRG